MVNSEAVGAYIGRLQEFQSRYTQANNGAGFDDESMVAQFISGLDVRYKSFVTFYLGNDHLVNNWNEATRKARDYEVNNQLNGIAKAKIISQAENYRRPLNNQRNNDQALASSQSSNNDRSSNNSSMTYQNNNNNNNLSGQFWCDYHQSNGSHATHDCYVLQRRKNQKNQRNNGGGKRKANNVTEDANEDHEDSLNLVYEQF